MTKNSPATIDRWAVSTRTNGTVLTAGVELPGVQLCLLGIPPGFTAPEIQSWLKDLAGVAIETSKNDGRDRPIPQLLHHALTGLLFSQTELWSHTGQALPCSAVFVQGPQGVAFGWVGRARVLLLVNGEPYEPQWVIVRDEAGQEAMSAMLPSEVHALITLDYWPADDDGQQAPAAIDAEWGHAARDDAPPALAELREAAVTPIADPAPSTPVATSAATEPAAAAVAPVPDTLPTQQPGLAPPPAAASSEPPATNARALDEPDDTQALPSTRHPSSGTFAMPSLPARGAESASAPPSEVAPEATSEVPLASAPVPTLDAAPATSESAPTVQAAPAEPEASAAPAPPAVWTPDSAGQFLPEPTAVASGSEPTASAEPATDVTPPQPEPERPLPPTLRERREQREQTPADAPRHPVGRWLSKLMGGLGRKAAPAEPMLPLHEPAPVASEAPSAPPTDDTPVSSYDAILQSPSEPAVPMVQESLPLPSGDIAEPHVLPAQAETPPVPTPTPEPLRRGGLAPAGLQEILGMSGTTGTKATPAAAKPAPAAPVRAADIEPIAPPPLPVPPASYVKPVEGLTAVSAASGPVEVTPESLTPATPYPMLEVNTPSKPEPRAPIHIDREPVGMDESFAIPKLPAMDAPKPVKVAVPMPEPTRPAAAPATPVPTPAAPVLRTPGAPGAREDVPEPPAAFLAEFEASMRVEPALDPQAASAAPPAAPVAAGPPTLRVPTPTPPSAPAPPRAPVAAPVTPPVPAPVAAAPATPAAPVAPAPPPPAPAPPAAAAPPPPPAPVPPVPVTTPAPPPAPPAPVATPVLKSPSAAEPVPVVPAVQAELMRELPLPTKSAEMARPVLPNPEAATATEAADAVPDGMLVATQAKPMPTGARSRLAAWPSAEELTPTETPVWRKPWAIVAFVTVLFGVGWIVGHSQTPDNDVHATPMSRVLRAVGLGGARFTASIDTDPPGAFITIDGKEIGRRTPSTVELAPGKHEVTLSMPDLGSVKVALEGTRGQKKQVNEALHGSLDVAALDPSVPVKMSLDGQAQGWLPVSVAKLPPGMHEVQFSGPNMQAWGQPVNILIRQNTKLVARPMMSPATGVVQVQASNNDDNGTAPLSGASVFVDGELRGSTPLTLELPRGPHSLRVTYQNETAPVQVIDLPGGNKRFASFQFGLDSDLPPLKLQANYALVPARKVTTVTATLDGLDVKDVREAWLHARSPEGLWRRYEMTLASGPRGATLSTVFPGIMFEGQKTVVWYLSAATTQGDDFYTEMQRSSR